MTSEHARRIAHDVADGIFGAGASETQRLGALAVRTINQLADQLDAPVRESGAEALDTKPGTFEPKPRSKPAQAHERKSKT